MSNYKFRVLDGDGRVHEEVAIPCEDDFAALDRAALLAAGRSVEIWRGERLLTHMRADGEAALDTLNQPRTRAAMAVGE